MTQTTIQPYLFFGGRCEEALAFYQRAIGAKLEMMMKFSESPEPPPPGSITPGFEDKVMHASLRIGDSIVMASDGSNADEKSQHIGLSLSCKTQAEVDTTFAALGEGGKVTMALHDAFWGARFGMVTDALGVAWMFHCALEKC